MAPSLSLICTTQYPIQTSLNLHFLERRRGESPPHQINLINKFALSISRTFYLPCAHKHRHSHGILSHMECMSIFVSSSRSFVIMFNFVIPRFRHSRRRRFLLFRATFSPTRLKRSGHTTPSVCASLSAPK